MMVSNLCYGNSKLISVDSLPFVTKGSKAIVENSSSYLKISDITNSLEDGLIEDFQSVSEGIQKSIVENSSSYLKISDITNSLEDGLIEDFQSVRGGVQKSISLDEAIDKLVIEIQNNFEYKFISFIGNSELSELYDCDVEKELFAYYKKNQTATLKWLSNIWLKNLDNTVLILNILKILSKYQFGSYRFSDVSIYFMVQGLFSHENIELRDFAIRFFESMANEDALRILENTKIEYPKWLEEYRQQVVSDIKEALQNM